MARSRKLCTRALLVVVVPTLLATGVAAAGVRVQGMKHPGTQARAGTTRAESAAAATVPQPTGTSTAFAVRVILPDGKLYASDRTDGLSGVRTASSASFAYPADGSVVVTGDVKATARTTGTTTAQSVAASTASNLSLFDGEITADSATAHSAATAAGKQATGSFGGTGVANLQALGVARASGKSALADWGSLTIGGETVARAAASSTHGYQGTSVALDVKLVKAHDGVPAGTEIQIGYAQATAQTAVPPAPTGIGPLPGDRPQLLPPTVAPLLGVPQLIEPDLTAGPYIFPVYGPVSFTDHYGDSKQGLAWERGADLVGQLGQPIIAVANGTLFRLGWNPSAGNHVSLRDHQGNQFLYAHLSAFALLARNGSHVRAGQVIGFMGDTGDLGGEGTHLHFEAHPVSMLFLAGDGAVDPGPYFKAWRRISSLIVPVSASWAPKVPGTIKPPQPGALMLGSIDISSTSSLAPGSLRPLLRPSLHG